MEFTDVLRRRRMVRTYDLSRPVPEGTGDRLVRHGLRAPSAGFTQGWGFLVLEDPDDLVRFRAAVTPAEHPENWMSALVEAPLVIVPHSNKAAYLERYGRPDKGLDDPESVFTAPYWDIDAAFAAMLIQLSAVDAGLGACFFGFPPECYDTYRAAFDVPAAFFPIGAISVGYPADRPVDASSRRKDLSETVHHGRWGQA